MNDTLKNIYGGEESYTHTTTCANCGTPQIYHIPKGTTVSSFMARQTCRNCGCRMVDYPREDRGGIRMVAERDDEREVLGP